MLIDFIILIVTFGCAFIVIGYENEARRNGWSVGEWLSGDTAFIKIFSVVTIIIPLGVSFSKYEWWTPIAVVLAGIVFGFIASQILKSLVQILAVIGAVAGWVLCLVYVL